MRILCFVVLFFLGSAMSVSAQDSLLIRVFFAYGEAEGEQGSEAEIDALAKRFKGDFKGRLLVVGHTDDTGDSLGNMMLSDFRSKWVAARLVKQGVHANKIVIGVFGENKAVVATHKPDQSHNRRVDVLLGPELFAGAMQSNSYRPGNREPFGILGNQGTQVYVPAFAFINNERIDVRVDDLLPTRLREWVHCPLPLVSDKGECLRMGAVLRLFFQQGEQVLNTLQKEVDVYVPVKTGMELPELFRYENKRWKRLTQRPEHVRLDGKLFFRFRTKQSGSYLIADVLESCMNSGDLVTIRLKGVQVDSLALLYDFNPVHYFVPLQKSNSKAWVSKEILPGYDPLLVVYFQYNGLSHVALVPYEQLKEGKSNGIRFLRKVDLEAGVPLKKCAG